MKYIAMLAAGVLGGVVAAAVYIDVVAESTTEAAPLMACDEGDEAAIAALESQNRKLKRRLDRIESAIAESAIEEAAGSGSADPGEPALAVISPELRKEILRVTREETKAALEKMASNNPTERAPAAPEESEIRASMLKQYSADLNSPDATVRHKAITKLRRIGGIEANRQIIASLNDANRRVRYSAARFFEEFWHDAALKPLIAMMNGDDTVLGEQALDTLGKSGNERALQELETYYLRGPEIVLAYEAGKALQENNRTNVIADGVQRFRDGTVSVSTKARLTGVNGLRRFGTKADASLVRALAEDPDPSVRQAVYKALKAWGLK